MPRAAFFHHGKTAKTAEKTAKNDEFVLKIC